MPNGTYTLNQTAPAALTFVAFQCYNTTTGSAVSLVNGTNVSLALLLNNSYTCVAVYSATLAPLPQLALISSFPTNYTGVSANLTATGLNSTCVAAPSQVGTVGRNQSLGSGLASLLTPTPLHTHGS